MDTKAGREKLEQMFHDEAFYSVFDLCRKALDTIDQQATKIKNQKHQIVDWENKYIRDMDALHKTTDEQAARIAELSEYARLYKANLDEENNYFLIEDIDKLLNNSKRD